jgi:adenylate cyclase
MQDDGAVTDPPAQPPARPPEDAPPPRKLRAAARRTDSKPGLVATAKLLRRILPGDDRYGDALSTSGGELSQSIGRLLSEGGTERPSAVREVGLGALQAWQALSEAQKRGRGTADVAILFTDLVGFSSWTLEAGDEPALELLRQVGDAEQEAIAAHGGTLVKRLGDGAMAVFDDPADAVGAALASQRALEEIEVDGYRPQLRAGVHLGRPRKLGRDYLGVDVNIAARVVDAAKGGEVLVSEPACTDLPDDGYTFGRQRKLKAPGAPNDLVVCSVRAAAS